MKKFLIIFGITFSVIIVILIALIGVAAIKGSKLDSNSKKFVDSALPQFCESWSIDSLLKYSVPEMKEVVIKEDFQALIEMLDSKLGGMTKYLGSTGESSVFINQHGKTISANYISRIEFEKDTAQIKTTLANKNGEWMIYNFNVNSPIFLEKCNN